MIHVTCIHLWMQPHLRWTVPFTRTTPHLAQQTKTAGERKKQSEASQRRAGWSPVPSEREKATLPGVSEPPCSEPVPTQLEPTFKQTSNMGPPISIKNRTKKKKTNSTMEPNDSYLNNFCTEQCWKPSHNNQIASWQMYRGQEGPCPSSCRLETGSRGKTHSSGEPELGVNH